MNCPKCGGWGIGHIETYERSPCAECGVGCTMKINDKGKALVKRFEGLRLEAYKCPANVWTIGYGSTGPHVKRDMAITPGEAERLLDKDLERFEVGVEAMLCGVPTSEDEYSAMVSLAFNIGLGAFATSTLLKRHKAGNKVGAAKSFLSWIYAAKKPLPGLIRRREAEKALYESEA
jgi:lysozyme